MPPLLLLWTTTLKTATQADLNLHPLPPTSYDPEHSHQPESMDIDSNSGDMSKDEEPSFIHPGDVASPDHGNDSARSNSDDSESEDDEDDNDDRSSSDDNSNHINDDQPPKNEKARMEQHANFTLLELENSTGHIEKLRNRRHRDISRSVREFANKYLHIHQCMRKQQRRHQMLVDENVLRVHPVLRHFNNTWPIYALTQQYLKNTVEQSRQAKKCNDKRVSHEEPTSGNATEITLTTSVTMPVSSSKSKTKKKAHTIVEVVSQDGIGKRTPKVAKQRQPTVKAPSKDNTTKGKSGHNTSQDKPSKSKKTVRPKPNYKSPDNHDINLNLETLGVKKTKGKQKQAPLPVPSAVNVSKKSVTNSIKKAKRKIIEDSVEDGAGPKTIEVKVCLLLCSQIHRDGARKSQCKSIPSARAHGANP
ncbi:hypothetical protein JB92DRAFT_2930356 [Gautieria morchelliformis]|nr:hypothetical protein JB92DRAFT_2930356 [Gautieria morchelliformis]